MVEGSSPSTPTNLELHFSFRKTAEAVLLSACITSYARANKLDPLSLATPFSDIISLMFAKIKNNLHKIPIQHFKDVRVLGLMVFGVLVLIASWSGVSVIEANYELLQQISQLDQKNQVQQLTNNNLKLQNEYFNTDTYLELTARKQLGKGAPGETLILVPKDVALAHTKQLPAEAKKETAKKLNTRPAYAKNFQDWMSFIFRRTD